MEPRNPECGPAEGGWPVTLTSSPGSKSGLNWSPDSRTLAYASEGSIWRCLQPDSKVANVNDVGELASADVGAPITVAPVRRFSVEPKMFDNMGISSIATIADKGPSCRAYDLRPFVAGNS